MDAVPRDTGVVGGMLGATILAVFLVPAFYCIIAGRGGRTIRDGMADGT